MESDNTIQNFHCVHVRNRGTVCYKFITVWYSDASSALNHRNLVCPFQVTASPPHETVRLIFEPGLFLFVKKKTD